MPSPFPGMDPFLEHPVLFPGFHSRVIAHLSEFLQAKLPEPYFAEIGERVWVEVAHRFIEPDVHVQRAEDQPVTSEVANDTLAVATALRTAPVVVHVPHDEHRETHIEIYSRHQEERLVTAVEVLSQANKTPGDHGRTLYQRKQKEILSSNVHLVEIDLLRTGRHTTAVPKDFLLAKVGACDYHICVHRFDNLEDYFVYPSQLPDPLPEIAIPLLPGDAGIVVDLQK